MNVLRDFTLMIAVIAGVLGASQVPRFVQEYEQRLGGALQEAERRLAAYDAVAAQQDLSTDGLVRRLRDNEDAAVAALSSTIADATTRTQRLTRQANILRDAPRLTKVLRLFYAYDPAILRAAWQAFVPTLTLDPSFAVVGLVLAWLANSGLWIGMRVARRSLGRAARDRNDRKSPVIGADLQHQPP